MSNRPSEWMKFWDTKRGSFKYRHKGSGVTTDTLMNIGRKVKGVFTKEAAKKLARKATEGIAKRASEEAGKVAAEKGSKIYSGDLAPEGLKGKAPFG